jgi:type III restriction enzyme
MGQVVIENPILNSPFAQPTRHFKFDDDGITNEIEESRRVSAYLVPIAQPKRKGKQLVLDTEWTKDRVEENVFINRVRSRVAAWRDGRYPGVTKTTAALLAYWTDPERDKKLFFCQIEALETAIYIAEAAQKYGDAWIENDLRLANQDANPLLDRMAFKMATGSGKTVVMAMLIAWQALNKLANRHDARFSDSFLIVTPGITIRDRLRVLLPNDTRNYYRERDVVPAYQMDKLGQARILITNFHAFLPRERVDAGKLTKGILAPGDPDRFKETPDQMVRRVCRELGTKKGIIVINDEAHHCYRRRVGQDEPKLTGEDRRDAEKRNEEARIWISGAEAVKDNTFKQLLLLLELAHDGADRIYQSITRATSSTKVLKPIVQPYDTLGSTRWVDFDTIRPTWATRADKCHISHVVADTDSWEQKLAQAAMTDAIGMRPGFAK